MEDLSRIIFEANRLRKAQAFFAVATVVKIEGSAYRRPGARMLITAEGEAFGAISAGCLEREIVEHALHVLQSDEPTLVSFDLADDDPVTGYGTGCGGGVHVLIEPDRPGAADGVIDLLQEAFKGNRRCVLTTIFTEHSARHMLVSSEGTVSRDGFEPSFRAQIIQDARQVLSEGRYAVHAYDTGTGQVEVLHEHLLPQVRLYICGSGPDVAPLVRVSSLLGWHVCVVGNKAPDELAERFPDATEWVFLMNAEEWPDRVAVYSERSAAVVMNHHYLRDRALLDQLLLTPLAYIGVLGPLRRTRTMMEEIDAQPVDSLYAPVGLDIGAETAEEIALSIVAEIQAVLNGHSGGLLRDRSGPIHEAARPA